MSGEQGCITHNSNDGHYEMFITTYPASRRQRGYMSSFLFCKAIEKVGPEVLFRALEQHKRSEQWQNGFIPSMVTWLQEERWIQVLPEPEIPASRLTPWELARRAGLK